MTALQSLLDKFCLHARTEREKGTYFEELIRRYLQTEPSFKEKYTKVWLFADWVDEVGNKYGFSRKDTGIDLVALTSGSNEYHSIQCKFFAADRTIHMEQIKTFITASGKDPFLRLLLVATTDHWGTNAKASLSGQTKPINLITLKDLENSVIDWEQYQRSAPPVVKEKNSIKRHQEEALEQVCAGLAMVDRGKMIHACGSGKTFTSLKIAEQIAGVGRRVLFMAPSLALVSQAITEYTQQSAIPILCLGSLFGQKRWQEKTQDG